MLRTLAPTSRGELIVGPAEADDAAVWRLDDDRALVATVDFITPLVDDARTWGRIAATNAVSDVYAMGARPLFGLNVVGWNADELPTELLETVLAGGAEVAEAGGWVVAGGHTVDDPEPKYGLAVIGEVDPGRLLRLDGLRPGDALVLTKPLGTGIVATAVKAGEAPEAVVAAAVAEMTRPNDDAARAAREAGAAGATDVTGFGLLGHLRRLVEAAGVDATVEVASVPLLAGVRELAAGGAVPGGTRANAAWVDGLVDDHAGLDETTRLLLADAQTSGGLLFGAAPERARAAADRLSDAGHTAAVVGRVTEGTGRIRLR